MAGSRKGKGKKKKKENDKGDTSTCTQEESLNVNHDAKWENILEKVVFEKIEQQYEKALEKLISLNYSKDVALKAMMISGCIYGPSIAILDNIVENSISYIKTGIVIDEELICSNGEPIIKDMKELVTYAMQDLIDAARKNQKPRFEALKYILWDKRIFKEHQCIKCEVDQNETENGRLIQAVLSLASEKVAASPDEYQSKITDLVDKINKLTEDLKERKQWAEERVIQTAKRLSHDQVELRKLRVENLQIEGLKKESEENIIGHDNTEVENKEDKLKLINHEIARVNWMTMNVKLLHTTNVDIKSRIAAYKLCESENESKLRLERKKHKKSLKMLSNTEKQVCELKRQIEQENHKIAQIEENVLQAAEAEKQAKLRQIQQMEAKKDARLNFLEEDRLKRKAKEEFELQVVAVRHELDANKQRLMNEIDSRKNLLSQLQQPNVATSSSSDDLMDKRSIKHLCLICYTNNVNVVFLPCKHEVTCEHCNFNAFDSLKAGCPVCKVRIEKRIKVFGPSM